MSMETKVSHFFSIDAKYRLTLFLFVWNEVNFLIATVDKK